MAFKQLPLNPDNFTMKLIEDLGRLPSPSNPKRFYRFAIFECTKCKQHFKARATGDKAKTQTCCINCAGSHNKSYDSLYAIWNGIRQRCYNPKRKDYHKYGGKGVTMSPEWKDDVTAFISWCEVNGWKPGLVIDKDIKSKEDEYNKIGEGLILNLSSYDKNSLNRKLGEFRYVNLQTGNIVLDSILTLNFYPKKTSKHSLFKTFLPSFLVCVLTTMKSLLFLLFPFCWNLQTHPFIFGLSKISLNRFYKTFNFTVANS